LRVTTPQIGNEKGLDALGPHLCAGTLSAGKQEDPMSVAKNTEITASGSTIEAAIGHGVDRATATLKNIKQVWVKEIVAKVDGGKISEYRVDMKITFVLDDA
jgi:dodecin